MREALAWVSSTGRLCSSRGRCPSGPLAKSSNRDLVSEVKAAVDIVEIISSYLDLKPAGGGRFKALCPFHNEKTPSFHVRREHQTFHCFGCDKGGDVFTFLQEIEGIGFREALEQLAERAGIQFDGYSSANKDADHERAELLKLQSFAARLYRETFEDKEAGGPGREYLRMRELSQDTATRFGLGYVPEGWQRLTDAARAKGYRDAVLERSGLAKRGQHGLYDHLRNRLIFPIRDASGKVVAFGGRALGDDKAKYINSPESPVYKKSRVLYGLHEAREALRRDKEAIIVEGYFDLLRCVDAGIENVVATCGTALTTQQAGLLKRYVSRVLVVYDGDEAGKRAALRSVALLVAAGLSVRAMVPPEGLDPDDYIRDHGPEAFRRLTEEAPDFVRFYVRMSDDRTGTIEGRTEVAKELFAVLSDIDDLVRQEEYVKLLARELSLDLYRCREEFAKYLRGHGGRSEVEHPAPEANLRIDIHDRDFIGVLLSDGNLLEKTIAALKPLNLTSTPLLEVLDTMSTHAVVEVPQRLASDAAKRLFAAAASGEDTWGQRAGELTQERILLFRTDALLQERERVEEEMYRAQKLNDDDRVTELALRKVEVGKQIEKLESSRGLSLAS